MPYCMGCTKYYNAGIRCPYCGSLINEETNTKGPVLKPSTLNNLKERLDIVNIQINHLNELISLREEKQKIL